MFHDSSNAFKLAELLAEQPELINQYSEEECRALFRDWRFWARAKQLPPAGDWPVWMIMAGRGFGKTWVGSNWVHERAMAYAGRWIALIARTPADARDYMIEGPSGLCRITPSDEAPQYEPTKRRLTWPNGSYATIFSDEAPDQTRGFSGDTAWLDEFAKFKNAPTVWMNLQLGMRESSNDRPRRLITTTPRPIEIIKELVKKYTDFVVTGSSYENRSNLDPTWFEEVVEDYAHTRIGRQEVFAEILSDTPGALWTRDTLEKNRVEGRIQGVDPQIWRDSWSQHMKRIVVAMDPAARSNANAAEHGIIVAGLGQDGHGYILEDVSARTSPEQAARIAINMYDWWKADRIVGEVNFGGDWIQGLLTQTALAMNLRKERDAQRISYKSVVASRGKQVRAEPISAIDEQGRVHHVGVLPELEDQMCTWNPLAGEKSPDRMDARVWALTELMVKATKPTTTSILAGTI